MCALPQRVPSGLRHAHPHFVIVGLFCLLGMASFSIAGDRSAPDQAIAPQTNSAHFRAPRMTALLSLTSPAPAVDFFVSPSGTDTNPGTMAKPFATPRRAIQAVRALVAGGLRADVIDPINGVVVSSLAKNSGDRFRLDQGRGAYIIKGTIHEALPAE